MSSLFAVQLHEQYRPSTFDDVAGQDKTVKRIGLLRQRGGLGGRSYWLSGKSGTGKTTIGRLIAQEVAGDAQQIDELDAKGLSPARIREVEKAAQTKGLFGSGWAVIVNEAHGLSRAAINQLLVTLERVPAHVVWVFTTTLEGEALLFDECDDAHPLLSRCINLPLASRGLADAFAQRAFDIAQAEGLGGKPLSSFKRAVNESRANLRSVLQAVESGEFLAD